MTHTIKDDGIIEADYNTDMTYPLRAKVSSSLKPTDRQQEFGRLLVKGLRQIAAGLGSIITAVAFYYGLPSGSD